MNLLDELIAKTGNVPLRYGRDEYHVQCPSCGKESTPRNTRCTFSERGWHCFACNAGGSLRSLADKLGVEGEYTIPEPKPVEPQKPRFWQVQGETVVKRFETHLMRLALWTRYKPISKEIIVSRRLGVGVLPSSRCQHERLIVPIFEDGRLIGLRGRAINCECDKWLTSAGTTPRNMPLYNLENIPTGAVIWIVENSVDALLIGQYTEFHGAASYSVSYWESRWTDALIAKKPEYVMVAYDNDLPGNGGAARRKEFIEMYLSDPKHNNKLPKAAGPALVGTLKRAGLRARLFDWGDDDYKADIGSILKKEYYELAR